MSKVYGKCWGDLGMNKARGGCWPHRTGNLQETLIYFLNLSPRITQLVRGHMCGEIHESVQLRTSLPKGHSVRAQSCVCWQTLAVPAVQEAEEGRSINFQLGEEFEETSIDDRNCKVRGSFIR